MMLNKELEPSWEVLGRVLMDFRSRIPEELRIIPSLIRPERSTWQFDIPKSSITE